MEVVKGEDRKGQRSWEGEEMEVVKGRENGRNGRVRKGLVTENVRQREKIKRWGRGNGNGSEGTGRE